MVMCQEPTYLCRFGSRNFQGHESIKKMLKLVFPTQYLVNQLMDFDQTCTEALLQEGSELIRFW